MLRQTSSALAWLIAIGCFCTSTSAQDTSAINWPDTFKTYLRTHPSQSITAFNRAMTHPDFPGDTLELDMYLAMVNDFAQIQNVDSAYSIAKMVNQMALEFGDSMRMAKSYLSVAWTSRDKGHTEVVLANTLKAEEIALAIGDLKMQSWSANTMASVYYDLKNDSLQKLYLEKAYALDKERGMTRGAGSTITNLGYIYFKEGDLRKAIQMFNESSAINAANGDLSGLRFGFTNTIDVYEALNRYDTCALYCDSLIDVFEKMQWPAEISHARIKKLFYQSNAGQQVDYTKALEEFNAIDVSEFAVDVKKIFLYDKYRFNGYFKEFETALHYLEQYRILNDSLTGVDLRDQIAFYKEQFDAEKREHKIVQLENDQVIANLEAEKQKSRITYLIIGLGITVVFILILIVLYNRLNRTKAALVEINHIKDKFFAIIAHDLRSPMIALQGIGQKLEYYIRKDKKEKMLEMGGKIDQSIDQLNHLLNNLLNWAVSQTGEMPHNPVVLDSKKLIEENLELYRSLAESKNIEIVSQLESNSILGDSNTINTVLRNIISNAIKFTKPNGKVSVSNKKTGTQSEIRITDEGVGMDQVKLKSLFSNKLASSDGSKGEKGFGIGLKISKEFIDLNRGELNIESEVGKGTTFILNLPLQ